MQLSTEIKNARLQAFCDAIDAGNATLRLLNADQAIVCELPFPSPCKQEIANGTLTFNTLPETLVLLSADIDSSVIVDNEENILAAVSVGDLASSADLKLPSLTLYQGGLIRLVGWTVSEL